MHLTVGLVRGLTKENIPSFYSPLRKQRSFLLRTLLFLKFLQKILAFSDDRNFGKTSPYRHTRTLVLQMLILYVNYVTLTKLIFKNLLRFQYSHISNIAAHIVITQRILILLKNVDR